MAWWRLAVVALLVVVVSGAWGAVAQDEETDATAVRIAYPVEPVAWYPPLGETTAAVDLTALWGLPLYRYDTHGQLRPGLARDARVDAGEPGGTWTVEIDLREGTWSDGEPVGARDVVATLEALRSTPHGETLQPMVSVDAIDDDTVALGFDRPYGRWPYLLAGGFGVLPAHVLRDDGIEAFRGGVPVSAGPFRLEGHEPGLHASFVAHAGSPLGQPELDRIDVYFAPSYETALGLLRDHRVDVVMGHLALNPVERARRVEGIQAAAPIGGTTAVLRWSEGGAAGALPVRESARGAVDVSQLVEGLLGPAGTPLTSTIPGHEGPWAQRPAAVTGDLEGVELGILLERSQEAPAFTGRVLQRDLRGRGAEVILIRVDTEELVGPGARDADAELILRRDGPRPSLIARAPAGVPGGARSILLDADAAATNGADVVGGAQQVLHEHAYDLPLYRVGVAHAWRSELAGLQPSSWPGVGWWDVTGWRWAGDPPPQEPAVTGATDAS